MGRAPAPQGRNHHHRPVISFKELCLTNAHGTLRYEWWILLFGSSLMTWKLLDTESGNRRFIFFGVRV